MGPDTAALVEIKAGQNVMAIVISNVFIDFSPLLILLGAKNSKSEEKKSMLPNSIWTSFAWMR